MEPQTGKVLHFARPRNCAPTTCAVILVSDCCCNPAKPTATAPTLKRQISTRLRRITHILALFRDLWLIGSFPEWRRSRPALNLEKSSPPTEPTTVESRAGEEFLSSS
jgi:hypothetical protein